MTRSTAYVYDQKDYNKIITIEKLQPLQFFDIKTTTPNKISAFVFTL